MDGFQLGSRPARLQDPTRPQQLPPAATQCPLHRGHRSAALHGRRTRAGTTLSTLRAHASYMSIMYSVLLCTSSSPRAVPPNCTAAIVLSVGRKRHPDRGRGEEGGVQEQAEEAGQGVGEAEEDAQRMAGDAARGVEGGFGSTEYVVTLFFSTTVSGAVNSRPYREPFALM